MALDHIGYGYGGYGQPNPYGYSPYSMPQGGGGGGYYQPNFFNNGAINGAAGGFYGNPFGAHMPNDAQQQKAQKDANASFFTKLFSRFSDSNSPTKQASKIMGATHPFDMTAAGSNYYNPYQLGHMDFGKAAKQK